MVIGAERELLIPLEKVMKSDYPQVNWIFRPAGKPISDEELNNADALIQGVAF